MPAARNTPWSWACTGAAPPPWPMPWLDSDLPCPTRPTSSRPAPTTSAAIGRAGRFVTYNDRVLKHLGGTWSAPPLPVADWELADDRWTCRAPDRSAGLRAGEFTDAAYGAEGSTALHHPSALARGVRPTDPSPFSCSGTRSRSLAPSSTATTSRSRFGLALWRRYVQQSVRRSRVFLSSWPSTASS